jgi:hypothetical protein
VSNRQLPDAKGRSPIVESIFKKIYVVERDETLALNQLDSSTVAELGPRAR